MRQTMQLLCRSSRHCLKAALALGMLFSAGHLLTAQVSATTGQTASPSLKAVTTAENSHPYPLYNPNLARQSGRIAPGFSTFQSGDTFSSPLATELIPESLSPPVPDLTYQPQPARSPNPFDLNVGTSRRRAPAALFPGLDTGEFSSYASSPLLTPAIQPTFSQLFRANLRFQASPFSSGSQFTFQSQFSPAATGSGIDFSRLAASGVVSTNLGNGRSLSAGTGFGGHTLPGTATGGLKHTGPAVGLKLSF